MIVKRSEVGRQIAVSDADYRNWIETVELPRLQAELSVLQGQTISAPIKISVLLPTYNSNIVFLEKAIDSVINQLYPNWQLCIVDDASAGTEVTEVLQRHAARDSRIAVRCLSANRGIAVATNEALAMAEGAYCALLDHDDVLSPQALLRIAQCIQDDPGAKLLYSDSDRLNSEGQRVEPFCKPEWNYDLFLGQNYLNHLTVYKTDLLRTIGGLREGFEGSQDYELALRAIESVASAEIVHVPEILYHWRRVDSSFSGSQLGGAVQAARRAVSAHLERQGVMALVKACPGALLYNRVIWPSAEEPIAIAVYGTDSGSVAETMQAWRQIHAAPYIHWSACVTDAVDGAGQLNRWAQSQRTRNVGFIAAGVSPLSAQAWESLSGHAQRADVYAVGAKYVTAGGLVLGFVQLPEHLPSTPQIACIARDVENSGYFASLALDRQVPALQAGCLLLRRLPFLEVGGWSRDPLSDSAAGVDLTRRLSASGGKLIWHPLAVARSQLAQLDRALCSAVAGENP